MPRRVKPEMKVIQRTIGFNYYHFKFFSEHPEFKPDKYCREAIDKQIAMIAPEFLPVKEEV